MPGTRIGQQLKAKLSCAARASPFCFGKRNQNHVRRTLAGTIKLFRFPALLAVGVPARTRAIHGPQTLRAFPTPPAAMLGVLYGARA